jgi:hypothetical protein
MSPAMYTDRLENMGTNDGAGAFDRRKNRESHHKQSAQ